MCIKEVLNWERVPNSIDDFQLNWLDRRGATNYNVILFSFAASAWNIWKVRNKMAFEGVFPRQPMDVIFKFLSCLQYWRTLIHGADRSHLDEFLKNIEDWSKNFCNLNSHVGIPVIA